MIIYDSDPLELGAHFILQIQMIFASHSSPSGDTIDGKLCFVTVGYLLQRLVNNPEARIVLENAWNWKCAVSLWAISSISSIPGSHEKCPAS